MAKNNKNLISLEFLFVDVPTFLRFLTNLLASVIEFNQEKDPRYFFEVTIVEYDCIEQKRVVFHYT